jgi:Ca2+-transporting ATPase
MPFRTGEPTASAADLERGPPTLDWPTFDLDARALEQLISTRTLAALEALGGLDRVAARLQVDLQRGIKNGTVASRQECFGRNRLCYAPPPSFYKRVLAAWNDVTLILLTIAAVVSLILGLVLPSERAQYGYLDGCAILVVVILVISLQATIAWQRERRFRSLNAAKDAYTVSVIRDGQVIQVVAPEVVVGDLVKLSAGDKVPADGILIQDTDFTADESTLTGESVPVIKTSARPDAADKRSSTAGLDSNHRQTQSEADAFVLSGTMVTSGFGIMLTVAVGMHSVWGQLLASLRPEPAETPLQTRLNRLARRIGYIGLGLALLVFLVLWIRWLVQSVQGGSWNLMQLANNLTAAIAIAVVAIPEGLPLAVVLSLAFAMRQMMKEHILVRRLEACETMGSATQLNVDKTGTMTWNQLKVTEALVPGGSLVDLFEPGPTSLIFRQLLFTSIALNSQADIHEQPDGSIQYIGNRTECALLELLMSLGCDYRERRAAHSLARIYLFDSSRKQMCSVQSLTRDRPILRLHVKGAPEQLLQRCVMEMNCRTGELSRISWRARHRYEWELEQFAGRGLRTLLVAFWDWHPSPSWDMAQPEPPETELILLGIFGMADPLRPETTEAILQLQMAGVSVRMVTGDNVQTATRVAQASRLLPAEISAHTLVWEASAFRNLDPELQLQMAKNMRVLARATPADKLSLVRLLQATGEVVAVTGDGSNDAPSLREADVGFGMGIMGTELAKEASDIVLMDDRLGSIVAAVLWGRNVLENIRKFLQFQLTVNVVAVSLDLFSACAGQALPLSTVPLLWVNVVMDSFGALALATESPRPALLQQQPEGRYAPLLTPAMYRNMFGIALYQLAVTLTLLFAAVPLFRIPCLATPISTDPCGYQVLQRNGLIFNTFVFMQLVSELNSRRLAEPRIFEGIRRARLFMFIVIVSAIVQVILVEVLGRTTIGQAIGIVHLTGVQWGASLALAALELPVGYAVRWWPLSWLPSPVSLWRKLRRLLPRRSSRASRETLATALQSPDVEHTLCSAHPEPTVAVGSFESTLGTREQRTDGYEALPAIPPSTLPRMEADFVDRSVYKRHRFRAFIHAAVALQRMDVSAFSREKARMQDEMKQAGWRLQSAKRMLRSRLWAIVGMYRMQRFALSSSPDPTGGVRGVDSLAFQLSETRVVAHPKQL